MDLFELLGTITIKNTEANRALEETSKKGQQAESKLGKTFKAIGKGAAVAGKAIGVGMIAAGTAVVGLVTKSTQAYAEYEQLVGGVDTLFKDSSTKVQAYARQAYETAGMSANEYMNTVTSFSASLLQSLGGDTEKAADKADTAIRDMSDNANKMGTSMESIQNAYQGFAKQNYTMLDNLKLGYGGTKEEMQRLLEDAEKLSGQKFDISSYADVVDAIHVIQTEMGITGTTAQEAAGTISGSMSSVKGAWTNLMTAMTSDDLPLDEYITKFVDSATTMVSNMLPRIQKALGGVVQLVDKLAPVIIGKIPELFSQLLPNVINAAVGLIQSIAGMLPDLMNTIVQDIIPALLNGLVSIVGALVDALPKVQAVILGALPNLIQLIAGALVELVPMLLEGIVTMVSTIAGLLPQVIISLVQALPMIAISLVDALIENLPIFIDGVVMLIMGLVDALPVIIGVLVDALPAIYEKSLTMLYGQLFPALIEAVIKLVIGICVALPKISDQLRRVLFQIIKGWWNGIKNIFAGAGDWFKKIFNSAKEGIFNAWSDFKARFVQKWNDVKSVFSGVGAWFRNIFSKAWEGIKNVFSGVKSFFTGLWGKIKDAFADLGGKLSDTISAPVKKAINSVIGGAEKIINGFFGMINKAIGAINEIPGVSISKIKMVEFTRLAKGGVVDRPTPAIFGEDGAEAVVPLENNTGWINRVATQIHEFMLKQGGVGGAVSIRSVELQQMQVSELRTLNTIANKILAAVLMLDENMGGHLREALDGVSLDINKREFARLVKGTI